MCQHATLVVGRDRRVGVPLGEKTSGLGETMCSHRSSCREGSAESETGEQSAVGLRYHRGTHEPPRKRHRPSRQTRNRNKYDISMFCCLAFFTMQETELDRVGLTSAAATIDQPRTGAHFIIGRDRETVPRAEQLFAQLVPPVPRQLGAVLPKHKTHTPRARCTTPRTCLGLSMEHAPSYVAACEQHTRTRSE